MKFKIDDNLILVARASNKSPEYVSTELCRAYIEEGIIDGDRGNWGETMYCATTEKFTLKRAADITDRVLGCCSWLMTIIYDLILLGDGDCPYCGGNLELIGKEGHHKPSHNYYEEPEYIVDAEVYRCDNCGERIYQIVGDEPDREEEWAMQRYEEKSNIN